MQIAAAHATANIQILLHFLLFTYELLTIGIHITSTVALVTI